MCMSQHDVWKKMFRVSFDVSKRGASLQSIISGLHVFIQSIRDLRLDVHSQIHHWISHPQVANLINYLSPTQVTHFRILSRLKTPGTISFNTLSFELKNLFSPSKFSNYIWINHQTIGRDKKLSFPYSPRFLFTLHPSEIINTTWTFLAFKRNLQRD